MPAVPVTEPTSIGRSRHFLPAVAETIAIAPIHGGMARLSGQNTGRGAGTPANPSTVQIGLDVAQPCFDVTTR